jgi:PBSX family phage terminase large subunit
MTPPLTRKQIISISESEGAMLSIWAGAVRSGKTVAAIVAFFIAVAKAPRSGEVVIVGRTLQTIERNIIAPMQDPAMFGKLARQVHHVRGSSVATILGRTVHLVGASDVRAESKIRGMTVALSMVDEATLVAEEFWNQLYARHSVPGARMLATTNPDARTHWLRKEWLLKAEEKHVASWHFTLRDNTFLTPEYVARIESDYSGLWFKRFVLGEWVQAEGAIFDSWDEDRMVVSTLPRIIRYPAIGIDYGTAGVFAALALGVGEDGRLYFTTEYRHNAKKVMKQLTDPEFAERVTGWRDAHGFRPDYVVVDPSASSFIQQLTWSGISATKGDNSVLDGIRLVSSLMATDRLRVHESCAGWIEEAPGYVWDDKAALLGEDKPLKVDDHSLDAGRYAIKTTEFTWSTYLRRAAAAA